MGIEKMKIIILHIIALLMFGAAYSQTAQSETKFIKGRQYTLVQEIFNTSDDKREDMVIMSGDSVMLRYTLFNTYVGCNYTWVELGYVLPDSDQDELTFYSIWMAADLEPVRLYTARKQVYKVEDDGRLALIEAKLAKYEYEDDIQSDPFEDSQLSEEEKAANKQAEREYMEELYNAKYVADGKETDQLFSEVLQYHLDKLNNLQVIIDEWYADENE